MSTLLQDLITRIAKVAEDKKATDIRVYQPRDTSVTDFIVIISIQNPIHGKSLLRDIDGCVDDFVKEFEPPQFYDHARTSGNPESGWIILDINAIIVHIISTPVREAYQLDAHLESNSIIYHL